MNESKLWTMNFVLICLTMFFVALTFYLLMTILAVYAIEEFDASRSMAGLVAGMFIIGALVARLLTGKYLEVLGRRKLIFGSLFLYLAATLLYFPVDSLPLLLAVRFIHGVAFGISTTALATAVMDIIPSGRRGEGASYYSLSPSLATAVGPFLGLVITQHADFDMVFIVCSLFSVMSIILMFFLQIPEAKISKEQIEAMKEFKLQCFFEKSAVPVSIIILIMGIGYSSILAFLNLYAIELNLTSAASFFFVTYSVFIFISRPFTGRLLDVRGDNIVMYPALLLFGLSLVLLSQAGQGYTLLLAGALVGLGFGTLMSCSQAIVVKSSPPHRIGLATSTFFFCLDAGVGTGPYLVGSIISIVGFRGMYLTLAVVVFLSVFLYYFVHGKKVR